MHWKISEWQKYIFHSAPDRQQDEITGRSHLFFQISDLYGERLFEKINFPEKSVEIEVNYVLHLTTLNYFERPPYTEFKTIKLENRLIELDYPDLKNIINKIKTIGLFS